MEKGKKSRTITLNSRIFRLLFLVADIFGVGSYYINKDLKIESSAILRLYGIALFLTILVYFIFSLYHRPQDDSDGLLYLEYVAYWTGSLTCFATSICKQQKCLKWLRKSWEIIARLEEKILKRLLVSSSAVTFAAVALIINFSVIFYTDSTHSNHPLISLIIYTTLYGVTVVMVLQFVTGITFLSSLFNEINDELETMLRQLHEKGESAEANLFVVEYRQYFRKQKDHSLALSNVRSLCARHHLYCSLTKELNDCYSLQMLLFTGICYVELTYSVFYFTISDSTEDSKPHYSVSFLVIWFLTYVTLLFGFTVSSQILLNKARKSGFLAHRIINRERRRTVKHALENFSLQVHQMGLEITAMGLFPVKNSLLYEMVGGVSSAIIILIQFHTYSTSVSNEQTV